jgi:DNA replication protein DnaD
MMGGYLRLYRSLLHHELWTGERFTRGHAWVDLLLLANYRDGTVIRGNRSITVKRGQVFTAQTELARRWRWHRETVSEFLGLLHSQGMIAICTSKSTDTGYTLISIRNYDRYQGNGIPSSDIHTGLPADTPSDIEPASTRHRTGNPKKKEKKGHTGEEAVSWTSFLAQNETESRELLTRLVDVLAKTRRGGHVAPAILDRLAQSFTRYPQEVVLQACRIFLDRDYAGEGKRENYLLGIVRGEARRTSSRDDQQSNTVPAHQSSSLRVNSVITRVRQELVTEVSG